MRNPLNVLLLAGVCFFQSHISIAQSSGFINRQATSAAGRAILDPDGNGYTSKLVSGFASNDVTNSEIPYNGVRSYSIEPNSDLMRGPNHSYSDFVPDSSGNGFYTYFTAASQVLFRFRVGSIMPGSKGYSVLMDTDGKFGATGPNADPNYLPATTGTNGNPGFEIEVVLETNFRIAIYNVDGTSNPVLIKQYTNWQDMSQVSVAATNDNGDPDFLIDFYIPFSDLQAAPFNLTVASSIRMTATTVMSPGAAIGGPKSDIYGVSTNVYDNFINGQPGCALFNTAGGCTTPMCTAAPTLDAPLGTGTVNITGTWTSSLLTGAASSADITVYRNGIAVGTVFNVAPGPWTLPNIALSDGQVITAKAVATGESMCLTSNAVTASTCNSTNRPATPVLACSSGNKGISGNNLSNNQVVHVDNMTINANNDNVTNTGGLFSANTGTSPAITWKYSGGCSSGAPVNPGSYKVYYTDNLTGCSSAPAYFCAAGKGAAALAGSLAVPTITNPSNNVYTPATDSISGTTDANAAVYLYINGAAVQTTTASAGGVFNFAGLVLLNGQQLYVAAELNTGTVSTSKCASQTPTYTVSCYTAPPLINADNNNQLTAGAPVTGTSTEASGTVIRVYNAANTLLATTTVQANGSWSTGNAGTTPATYNAVAATSYYANAQNGSCGVSNNSATYTAVAPTSPGRCGTITGPVGSGATTISGTLTGSFTTTKVNLYLDGQLIDSTTTTTAAWTIATINSTYTNKLYPYGVLTIGIQETGKQEVACAASMTITCTPTPLAPVFTPTNTSITQNQSVTYTISNAVAGAFYAIADSATGNSLGQGIWAPSNGSLALTTTAVSNTGTYKVLIKSTSLSGVTECSGVSTPGTMVVSSGPLPLTLIQFTGKKQDNHILLNWITENESQLKDFMVERSVDGSSFVTIGDITAKGSDNTRQTYNFTDLHPAASMNYYRLKMMDNDGRYRYSGTVVFMGNAAQATITGSIAPNPFTKEFTVNLHLEKAQAVTIQILNSTGRGIFTKTVQGLQGDNAILCDGLSQLAEGIYFVSIYTASGALQQKVLKHN